MGSLSSVELEGGLVRRVQSLCRGEWKVERSWGSPAWPSQSCHGNAGPGDGEEAADLPGPGPRNRPGAASTTCCALQQSQSLPGFEGGVCRLLLLVGGLPKDFSPVRVGRDTGDSVSVSPGAEGYGSRTSPTGNGERELNG